MDYLLGLGPRRGFRKLETYVDFEKLVRYKRIFEDAAKIVSAPFLHTHQKESVSVRHNTVDYYNSEFRESRRDLLSLSASPGIFWKFIRDNALPKILAGDPSVVGISVTHPDQYVFSAQLAHAIRREKPEAVIVAGGNTISRRVDVWSRDDEINKNIFRNSRSERRGLFDVLVVSEGELALRKIVENQNMELHERFKDVPGVIFNRGGEIILDPLPNSFAEGTPLL